MEAARASVKAPAAAGGRITVATWVTLGRGVLIGGVAACALADAPPRVWGVPLAGILYGIAVLADSLDGWLARRRDEVTALGARLDVETDAAGLLVASVVGARTGTLPPWYLLLGAAYYIFRAGLLLRRRLGLPVFPERLRRYPLARGFAAAQMATVALALVELVPPTLSWPLATIIMLPTLALMTREWRLVTSQDRQTRSVSQPTRRTSFWRNRVTAWAASRQVPRDS